MRGQAFKSFALFIAVASAFAAKTRAEPMPADATWAAHAEPLLDMAFSPDGQRLATVGDDGKLKLWDVATHKELGTLDGCIENQNAVRFTPDGKAVLALGLSDSLVRMDAQTGKPMPSIALHSPPGGTSAFDVSPDVKTLAAVGRGSLRILSIDDGSEKYSWEVHPLYGIPAVAFSPDGKLVATAATDHKANVIEPTTGKILQTLGIGLNGKTAVFSRDSKRLLVASSDGSLRSFDVATGEATPFAGTDVTAQSLATSPDGTLLYVAAGGHGPLRFGLARNDADTNGLKCDALIKTVAVSPDGKTVAGGGLDGSVNLWKVAK